MSTGYEKLPCPWERCRQEQSCAQEWALPLTLPLLGVQGGASHCAIVSPPWIVTNGYKRTCGKGNILLLWA